MKEYKIFKIEIIDNGLTWGYKLRLNNSKKVLFSADEIQSYESAVKKGMDSMSDYINNLDSKVHWTVFIDPNPRILELIKQEELELQQLASEVALEETVSE